MLKHKLKIIYLLTFVSIIKASSSHPNWELVLPTKTRESLPELEKKSEGDGTLMDHKMNNRELSTLVNVVEQLRFIVQNSANYALMQLLVLSRKYSGISTSSRMPTISYQTKCMGTIVKFQKSQYKFFIIKIFR